MIAIYAIVNTQTGRKYIGGSANIRVRFVAHRSTLRRGKSANRELQAAWNDLGEEAFEFVILKELLSSDGLLEWEQHYLDLAAHNVYNTSDNAASPRRGVTLTPETRQLMSLAQINNWKVGKHDTERVRLTQLRNAQTVNKIKRAKTHCRNGHPYDDAYVQKRGGRRCRTCQTLASQRWYAAKKKGQVA